MTLLALLERVTVQTAAVAPLGALVASMVPQCPIGHPIVRVVLHDPRPRSDGSFVDGHYVQPPGTIARHTPATLTTLRVSCSAEDCDALSWATSPEIVAGEDE